MELENLEKLAAEVEEKMRELKNLKEQGEEIIRRLGKLIDMAEFESVEDLEITKIKKKYQIKREKLGVRQIEFDDETTVCIITTDCGVRLDGLEFLLTIAKEVKVYQVIAKALANKANEIEFMIQNCKHALSLFES